MVTGAAAAIVYGEPRLTHDLDLVIELGKDELQSFIEAFPSDVFYVPPEEVIRVEISRSSRGHFNLIHKETGFKADIYLMGDDPLHLWAMDNRRKIDTEAERIWVAPPEYVIIRKLQYHQEGGSEKHLSDIRGILEISSSLIDQNFLEATIIEMALDKSWKKVESGHGG